MVRELTAFGIRLLEFTVASGGMLTVGEIATNCLFCLELMVAFLFMWTHVQMASLQQGNEMVYK